MTTTVTTEKSPSPVTRPLPVLDLAPFLEGRPGAEEALARELRFACENLGFLAVRNHGIDPALIGRAFAETKRFHDLPAERKLAIEINRNQRGYVPPKATFIKHSQYNENTKLDSNATLVVATEHAADNPHRRAGKQFYGENQWPADLPGFRETVTELIDTLTALGKSLLPVWARALDLPRDFFDPYFVDNYTYCRLAHYPPNPDLAENEFGIGPHADTGFMTFLPQADVPGLEILDPDGVWFRPEPLPGCMVVNTGQFLERWSNERFRATPHRVLPPPDRDRYSVAVFVNSNFERQVECLPTCHGPDRPAKYQRESYWDFFKWYMTNAYPHYGEVREEN